MKNTQVQRQLLMAMAILSAYASSVLADMEDVKQSLAKTQKMEQALSGIKELAQKDPSLLEKGSAKALLDLLIQKYPGETRKNHFIAGSELDMKGANDWLKEFASTAQGKMEAVQALEYAYGAPDLYSQQKRNYGDSGLVSYLVDVAPTAVAQYQHPKTKVTILMWAAFHGNADLVKKLLAAGAQADAQVEDLGGGPTLGKGATALHLALFPLGLSGPGNKIDQEGRVEAVKELLKAGADVTKEARFIASKNTAAKLAEQWIEENKKSTDPEKQKIAAELEAILPQLKPQSKM